MATGSIDANGIWQYGEDDSEPTFSGLLNKLAASTSTKVSSLKASDTTSGTFAAARIPNLENLNGTLDVASGGTGSTSVTGAQEGFKVGLLNIIPPTAVVTGAGSGGFLDGNVGQFKFYTATSVALNNVFSDSYRNYKILVSLDGASGITLNARLRASGTDLSTAVYNKEATTTNSAGATSSYSANFATTIQLGSASQDFGIVNMDLSAPAKSLRKSFTYMMSGYAGSNHASWYGGGNVETLNQYDGIDIYPSSGVISGFIQVFAYND